MLFHASTQREHWLFRGADEVERRREAANRAYADKHARQAEDKGCGLLVPGEEALLCQYYTKKLLEFCDVFQPPVPRSALGTAAGYLKRFYLNSSVMEFHPRDIFLCCTYLAFKVEEYNVSVDQFVHVLAPQLRVPTADLVLSHELLLLKRLTFHLTVHSPFRALEGFLIDMKTRSPDLPNPDQFRRAADVFLVRSLCSDVSLLYPPSQIALAALRYSSRQTKVQIDGYILSVLLRSEDPNSVKTILALLQSIEDAVLAVDLPDGQTVGPVEKKLERCLAIELSPKSRKRKNEDSGGGESGEKKSKINEGSPSDQVAIAGITRLP